MSTVDFDVFLSHNGSDKPRVERIAELLKQAGIRPWFDGWCLTAGGRWQEELVAGLQASSACAVFLGPEGLGEWEREEIAVALGRAVADPGFRLFLVLLPGLPDPFEPGSLPPLLSTRTWVDLRRGLDHPESLERLVAAVRPEAAETSTDVEVCPYRGLATFDEEHADLFFGREGETQRLVERLRQGRFLAVLGPSGSGKSSLVRAGLIPALRQGALPGSERWTVRLLTPGAHPLTTLAAHLLRLHSGEAMQSTVDRLLTDSRTLRLAVALARVEAPADDRVLWVVDQLEEVFTLCRDAEARRAFLTNLLDASSHPAGRNVVVVTLRADFYPRCADLPELAARLASQQFLVGPLSEDGLRRVIEQPARQSGFEIEPGLVGTVLDDVAREPGALPLLEHALLELWRRRSGRRLTLRGYRAAGGVEGSLAQRAEEVFGGLSGSGQRIARQLLLRLTEPGEGTEDTRRRAHMAELRSLHEDREEVASVIDALVAARLLTTSRAAEHDEVWIDVAHEALIRGWPRLKGWIDEDRAGLVAHRRLTEAALEWARLGRETEALYGGGRLAEAEALAERRPELLNALEKEFLTVSRRRGRRRQRLAAIGGLTAVILFGLAAAFFLRQRNLAVSRELAAYAVEQLAEDPELSMLLALEAMAASGTREAEDALRQSLLAPQVLREWRDEGGPVEHRFSPDGRYLAVREHEQLAVWDVARGERRLRVAADDLVWGSGGIVATAGVAGIEVWEPATGRRLVSGVRLPDEKKLLAVAREGRRVAVRVGADGVEVLATHDGASILGPYTDIGTSARFSADGEWLLISGLETWQMWSVEGDWGYPRLWEGGQFPVLSARANRLAALDAGKIKTWWIPPSEEDSVVEVGHGGDGSLMSVAISSCGLHVGAGDHGGGVWLFDNVLASAAASGGPLDEKIQLRVHEQQVNSVTFHENCLYALSASSDRTVALLTLEGAILARLRGHRGRVLDAAFGPEADQILTTAPEAARLWRVALNRGLGQSVSLRPHAIALGRGSRQLAVAGTYGVTAWNVETGAELVELKTNPERINRIALSPEGDRLAIVGSHGRVRLVPLDGGTVHTLAGHAGEGHVGEVEIVVFGPLGERLLTADESGLIGLWDLPTSDVPRLLRPRWLRLEDTVTSAAFSPDGKRVVVSGREQGAKIWSLDDGEPGSEPVDLALTKAGRDVAFDARGRRIATVGEDGVARIWSPSGALLAELPGEVPLAGVAFSPDATILLTWDDAGIGRLWRLADRRFMAELDGRGGPLQSARFSTDSRLVLTIDVNGHARAWDARAAGGRLVVELPQDLGGIRPRPADGVSAWSADGRQLFLVWGDGQVEVQDCQVCGPVGELLEQARQRVRAERPLSAEERRKYLHEP